MRKILNETGTAQWDGDDLVLRIPLSTMAHEYMIYGDTQIAYGLGLPNLIDMDAFKAHILGSCDRTYLSRKDCDSGWTAMQVWLGSIMEEAMLDPGITKYEDDDLINRVPEGPVRESIRLTLDILRETRDDTTIMNLKAVAKTMLNDDDLFYDIFERTRNDPLEDETREFSVLDCPRCGFLGEQGN